jgi:hypothetical protein
LQVPLAACFIALKRQLSYFVIAGAGSVRECLALSLRTLADFLDGTRPNSGPHLPRDTNNGEK